MSKIQLILVCWLTYYSCSALPTRQNKKDGKGPTNYEDCPIGDPVQAGLINNDGTNYLPEASGLAYSRRTDGVLWTFNDSGRDATAFAISEQGDRIADVILEGIENIDWEDIAINVENSASGELVSMIYIADMGNNRHNRDVLYIHKFAEPAVTVDGVEGDYVEIVISADDIETIEFTWPDYSHDCEALAVDVDGEMLLFTKDKENAVSEIYKVPRDGSPGELRVVEYVSQLPLQWVTAAEIAPLGDTLAISCNTEGWSYSLPPGQTWVEYLASDPTPCFLNLAVEEQREGITVTATAYWTTSESSGEDGGTAPLWYYERYARN